MVVVGYQKSKRVLVECVCYRIASRLADFNPTDRPFFGQLDEKKIHRGQENDPAMPSGLRTASSESDARFAVIEGR